MGNSVTGDSRINSYSVSSLISTAFHTESGLRGKTQNVVLEVDVPFTKTFTSSHVNVSLAKFKFYQD